LKTKSESPKGLSASRFADANGADANSDGDDETKAAAEGEKTNPPDDHSSAALASVRAPPLDALLLDSSHLFS
jgi:hypothetical protein